MKTRIYSIILAASFALTPVIDADDKSRSEDASQQGQQSSENRELEGAGAQRAEKGQKLTMEQLPEAVRKNIGFHAEGLNVENITKQEMNGQTVYKASFDKDNMRTSLLLAEDGSLLKYEQSQAVAVGISLPRIEEATSKQLSDLPQAVQDTIKEKSGSAEVGNITKGTHEGQTVYHAAFNQEGSHVDLYISENGDLIAQSQQTALFIAPLEGVEKVSLSSAPESVRKTIEEQTGATEVTDIDKGTWKGQAAYKVMIQEDGKPKQLVVAEDGKILSGGEEVREAAGAETALQMRDLPDAVQQAIREKADAGQIESIEKVTKDGQTVFQIHCQKDGERKTLQISEEGRILE